MKSFKKAAIALPLLILAVSAISSQSVMAQALATPSEADIRALFKPTEAEAVDPYAPPRTSRAFKPTKAPTSEGLCANQTAPDNATSHSANTRNLASVPYSEPGAPSLDMPIQFDLDSDRIRSESKALLAKVAAIMNEADKVGSTFAVAGHTDPSGANDRNLKLSCARALAVKAELERNGVSADRLTAYGFGSSKPLAGASTPEAQRRVELRRAL